MSRTAYEKALELPIHGVEVDVRMTKDGVLLCHHDRTMLRQAGSRQVVSRADAAVLQQMNIGTAENPEYPMTLDELVELVLEYDDKHLYIEAKHPQMGSIMIEEQILLCLQYHGVLDDPRFHYITFSHSALRRMWRMAPQLDRIYLRRDWEFRFQREGFGFAHPSAWGLSLISAKLSPEFMTPERPVYLFTVNDAADMQWAADHGVAMLATDYLERALSVIGEEPVH